MKKRAVKKKVEPDKWLRIRVILPIECKPLWDEIQERLRDLEVSHPNKGVEAGMHVEILCAEFLAGTRVPSPEKWWGQHD